MIKCIELFILVSFLFIGNGCMSYMSARSSSKELANKSNPAVKAVRTSDGAGVGIDIFNLEALKLHPIRQTLSAIGDAVVIYATYDYIDGLDKKSSKGGSSRDTSITVSGDNNYISINGDTTTTTDTDMTTTTTDNSDNSAND